MSIVRFIRLIKNHLALLLLTPIIISSMTLLLLDDSSLNYVSSCKVYTGFASGYSIKNNARRDFYAIKTKFDNFFESAKSRSTQEEIILKTLAFYLAKESIPQQEMQIDNQSLFDDIFTDEVTSNIVVKDNHEKTFINLSKQYYASSDNIFYLIINSRESPLRHLFGLDKLSEIEINQEGTSDLVLMTYESIDPGITFETMRITLDVLLSKVKMIKFAESNSVVKYFQGEVIRAQKKLDEAEKELAILMTKNNITNYYEQTKWLASRNEDFEVAFQKEKLGLAAAEAAEKEAIAAMGISSGIKMKNNKILILRKSIRKLNERKVDKSILNGFLLSPSNVKVLNDSTITTNNLDYKTNEDSVNQALILKQQELNKHISELLEMKNSASGIQLEDIANKWLESIIKVEEYKARIIQFIQFEKEFEASYSRFSKLGSQLKQLERKIGVFERDYLDFVVSLNDAKLIEENIKMSSSLKVIDPPFYPLDPEKSKKILIVILTGLVGFIFCLGILIGLEYLDESIRTPKKLSKVSKLDLIGGFPIIENTLVMEDKILHNKLIKQIATFINYSYYEDHKRPEPFVVLLFSTREKEGKTKLSELIAKELRNSGERTLVINSSTVNQGESENTVKNKESEPDNIMCYRPTNIYDEDLSDIIKNQKTNINLDNYRYILFEVTSLIGNDLPIKIIKNAHLSLLIAKASRVWNKADSMAINTYKSISNHPLGCIINGTMVDELETIIGEIPKKRSPLRKKIKKMAKFEFRVNKF